MWLVTPSSRARRQRGEREPGEDARGRLLGAPPATPSIRPSARGRGRRRGRGEHEQPEQRVARGPRTAAARPGPSSGSSAKGRRSARGSCRRSGRVERIGSRRPALARANEPACSSGAFADSAKNGGTDRDRHDAEQPQRGRLGRRDRRGQRPGRNAPPAAITTAWMKAGAARVPRQQMRVSGIRRAARTWKKTRLVFSTAGGATQPRQREAAEERLHGEEEEALNATDAAARPGREARDRERGDSHRGETIIVGAGGGKVKPGRVQPAAQDRRARGSGAPRRRRPARGSRDAVSTALEAQQREAAIVARAAHLAGLVGAEHHRRPRRRGRPVDAHRGEPLAHDARYFIRAVSSWPM